MSSRLGKSTVLHVLRSSFLDPILNVFWLSLGSHLGLPAAQELISRHGGLIEFDSRPGRTVFYVRIPLLQDVGNE